MRVIRGNVEREAEGAMYDSLIREGYKPVKAKGDSEKESPENHPVETEKNLEEMNVTELRTVAKERGITGSSSLNKEQLLMVLKG